MYLLLPPHTDIRTAILRGWYDVVECPAGSSRWYITIFVDDVGKGFPNEFRFAELSQISDSLNTTPTYTGATWPVPMP
jgi:hypothetical protein